MLTAKCPQLHPYNTCDRYDVKTNTFGNSPCIIIDTNDQDVTCSCPIITGTSRRLLASSSSSSLVFASKKTFKYDLYHHQYADISDSTGIDNDNNGVGLVRLLLLLSLLLLLLLLLLLSLLQTLLLLLLLLPLLLLLILILILILLLS